MAIGAATIDLMFPARVGAQGLQPAADEEHGLVSPQSTLPEREATGGKANEAESEPITMSPIDVVERREAQLRTGTLGLSETSTGSSRLGLTIREIPASVEVIGQAAMQERGFRTISEAAQGATGVSFGDAPGSPANFSMRGFTGQQLRLLYDGLVIGPASMTSRPRDTWNLDRIEILKGPASVLYGEGAMGGGINFVTKRPTLEDRVTTDALVSYGTFNTLRAAAGSGGAIGGSGKLHYRADLSYQHGDQFTGVQRSPFTYWNWTSAVRYDVTRDLDLELSFDIAHDQAVPYWGTPLVAGAFASGAAVHGVVAVRDGRTVDARLLRQNFGVIDGDMSALTHWTKLKAAWRPTDRVEIRNQAYHYSADRNWQNAESYRFNTATQLIDRDRFLVQHDQRIIGDRVELQVNEPILGYANRFLVGLDFTHLDFTRPSFFSGAGDSVSPFGLPGGAFGGGPTARQTARIVTTALFAEEQFSVTDRLKVVAGVRYDHVDLDRELFNTAGVLNTATSLSRTFNPTTWRAGVVYDVLPGLTLYGQYATAADPVGANLFLVRANQNFDLATGAQWEIGLKQSFWGDRGEWTLAYYDIFRKNILTADSPTTTVNVGRQTSKGVELSAALRPTDAWRLQGNLTFLSARFADFSEGTGTSVISQTGNRPPNVPEAMANLTSIYRWQVPLPFDLGGTVRYVGSRYSDNANTIRMQPYVTADVWISVPYRNVSVMLRGRNLLDKTYAVWADPAYPSQVLIGAPRTVELMLLARF
ncbi:MAG: TonB-dependent receptor [Nitrospiraceae bacterium]